MKSPHDVFDMERFWTDVEKYMVRHNYSNMDFCHKLWIDPAQFRLALKNRKGVSMRWAVIIAKECDLSLDSYIL